MMSDLPHFRYENSRRLRVAIIHGLARMAAIMASTYKPYLGVGLGPLSVSVPDRSTELINQDPKKFLFELWSFLLFLELNFSIAVLDKV